MSKYKKFRSCQKHFWGKEEMESRKENNALKLINKFSDMVFEKYTLEQLHAFALKGPKACFRLGLLKDEGWRAGYTKKAKWSGNFKKELDRKEKETN